MKNVTCKSHVISGWDTPQWYSMNNISRFALTPREMSLRRTMCVFPVWTQMTLPFSPLLFLRLGHIFSLALGVEFSFETMQNNKRLRKAAFIKVLFFKTATFFGTLVSSFCFVIHFTAMPCSRSPALFQFCLFSYCFTNFFSVQSNSEVLGCKFGWMIVFRLSCCTRRHVDIFIQ